MTYESILSGLPVQCVRALSGFEALERLLKDEFAVILLDVNMPGMDGFEVARLVRERPRLERTPIIFVTGVNITELDQLKGYEVGAIDYLPVPVVPEVLRTKVSVLVELHHRRGQLAEVNRELEQARQALECEHSQALAQKDAQLRAVFEHPLQFMFLFEAKRDASGEILDWYCRDANALALRLLDQQRPEVVGRRLAELCPPEAAEISARGAQVLREGKAVCFECRFRDRIFSMACYALVGDSVIATGFDITEAKETELQLRASERRQHALLENAPVAVAHNAMDGRFQYVNKAFCQLVGYTSEELYEKTWQDVTHPDDVEHDAALGFQVLAGQIPDYTLEKRYIRKDGADVWVRLFGNFVLDDAGRPTLGVAVAIDVTQQRQADEALRQNQYRLVLAKAAAHLGIHDWDLESGVIDWDPRTRELWGVGSKEVVTYDVFMNGVHPDDRDATQKAVDKALDPAGDGSYRATYRVINRVSGTARWVEATGQVYVGEGQARRLVGTVQDVTEQFLSLERLKDSEQRFRELANSIDQFAWTCDELGQATWYNDRWYEYTGTSFEEMRGAGWQRLQDPAHLERVNAHLRECLKSGKAWEDTFPLRGKDGQYRWFLSRAVPIRDDGGRVIRWFGTNTDITEQLLLQEQLKQADQRKDEFLAMLAHELRNPIAPIRTGVEVLARLLSDVQRVRLPIAIIRRQAEHLSRLLDDLLDVARITQRRIELKREVIDLRSCVEAAIETVEPSYRDKGQHLTITQAVNPLYVDVDRVRISLCIANLLSNSARYTPAGGKIHIASDSVHGMATVTVIDTGIGISPDFLPKVFELFSQAGRALDRSQGGLGVGLFLCRELIELHGGTVTAASAGLGTGATFAIQLPLCEMPIAAPRAALPTVTRSGLRVLIVDDNQDAADSLAELLRISGHQTTVRYSAEGALEEFNRSEPQVVLLDVGLPQMDGYEVARRIKRLGSSARLIALSGYGQPKDKERAALAGFDSHLTKLSIWRR